ncbi:DUF6270 domain-containing protein [Rheinheimera baltica]|uniref:DUF6270 domain-containing protein n=1 Tax=Rheinheimera baltica TaxID=67576 RepID=UPI00273E9150|nr:DUF6270 domain-containing protein [Rheinheimera baltica]MDP5191603.1 DUF6270 domain-containing protein [Rheinheimera baltica]
MRLFIYGSCVSRDAFEFQSEGFDIVKYVARSSLAVQHSAPLVLEQVVNQLPSAFQREMMTIDMDKSLFSLVKEEIYDVFLIDFIDERFGIAQFDTGARITVSAEFIKAKTDCVTFDEINRFSQQKFELWQRGFDALMQVLANKTAPPKVVINKVYFTGYVGDSADDAVWHSPFSVDEIDRNNAYLNKLYNYVQQHYRDVEFITYDDAMMIADKQHKWGIAPFHFIADFYLHTIKALSAYNKAGVP